MHFFLLCKIIQYCYVSGSRASFYLYIKEIIFPLLRPDLKIAISAKGVILWWTVIYVFAFVFMGVHAL